MEMTSYAKARSNLWMLNDANTEKQSLDLLFLSSLKKIPAKFSQENRGHNKLVPRLHSKNTNIKSASNQT
jgi:hypothetical protein